MPEDQLLLTIDLGWDPPAHAAAAGLVAAVLERRALEAARAALDRRIDELRGRETVLRQVAAAELDALQRPAVSVAGGRVVRVAARTRATADEEYRVVGSDGVRVILDRR